MKATDYFKSCCKLIETVNNNYSHIVELEELQRVFNAVPPDQYWRKEAGIEYDLLSKIAWETRWNHYKRRDEKLSPWGIQFIMEKLQTTDELSEILPREDLDKYPTVKIEKYI